MKFEFDFEFNFDFDFKLFWKGYVGKIIIIIIIVDSILTSSSLFCVFLLISLGRKKVGEWL